MTSFDDHVSGVSFSPPSLSVPAYQLREVGDCHSHQVSSLRSAQYKPRPSSTRTYSNRVFFFLASADPAINIRVGRRNSRSGSGGGNPAIGQGHGGAQEMRKGATRQADLGQGHGGRDLADLIIA